MYVSKGVIVGEVASAITTGELSERERAILDFERHWWKHAGAKEITIKELFDLNPARYYELLNAVIDRPEALEADPMLVKRLRRMRDARTRDRSARRLS
ncbi:unannotated protein [freshwater metagenome]|uniref:Unannotated protein n=1 Tax=freshwater metagenome TaxID=449393 RepID=A0A6J6MV48_9ZZZZ|nr:DUF3263 domain-containing protein [Actinomycetota bacterium]MSY52501.1 DUF3263 domain-containing protein [Actinomycetota bacterium]MSY87636.1 DUF3263 domain-containing protein [Actinomycetota bacterium]MTA50453.1 DUF3263 domain-containing protein [Actinomycetota bacterium]